MAPCVFSPKRKNLVHFKTMTMDLWVKQLNIKHFRGIRHLDLDFNSSTPIVFIGINGVGKSSVLDCLVILLAFFVDLLLYSVSGKVLVRYEPEMKIVTKSKPLGGRINSLRARQFSMEDFQNGQHTIESSIQLSLEQQTTQWSIMGHSDGGQITNDPPDKFEQIIRSINSFSESSSRMGMPMVLHYSVDRAVSTVPLDIIEHKPDNSFGYPRSLSLTSDSGFRQFFKWFRTSEDLENEERRDDSAYRDRQLEAVRQAIASLLPGFSNLRVRRSPLRMTISKDNEDLVITQLSDGEKCLMAMVGDIARRLAIANPKREDPLKGSGIILIDEIELHLHPDWQRRVIPSLTKTFPNCQFIVTTHSPQVISHVKPEGIYLLEKQGEEITARHPESSFGRDSNRILEDLMGVPERPEDIKENLMELFRLIDQGNLDQARQVRQALAQTIGTDEPAFAKADVMIRRKEILNG